MLDVRSSNFLRRFPSEGACLLVELRDGGVFLQPAQALPLRDIPEATLRGGIADDEKGADKFWRKAGKA